MGYLLHQSVDEWASTSPSAEAFRFDGAALTYEALALQANRLAHVLLAAGVRPGDRVGIYMYKGLELPVAVYGILKAGAAYVPIDPSAPPARVQLILADCGIRHLVTSRTRARRALDMAARCDGLCTVVGADPVGASSAAHIVPWTDVDRASAQCPDVRVMEEDLAYVMYTSGSTGVPKGLMHTHASGLAYARLSACTYGVRSDDRLGNHSPLHFDMSTFEFLTGPLCGATTVLVPEETTMFPVSLAELIERERLTFWYSVPLALIQLLLNGGIECRDMRSVRWVLFGGEPFPPKHLWRLMTLWPHARFSNVYGPAEVNQCTFYHVPPSDVGSAGPAPIGRVWANSEGMVVDGADQPVPAGTAGELVVRTPTMMRGYWGRPDLARTAFLDVEPYPGFVKRFYRTGDLVREREDGQLVFLGRKDRQVKVRGYRVELDEVESVLASLAGVAEAAVVALWNAEGGLDLVGAVRSQEDGSLESGGLRRLAAEHLPGYAVPVRIDIVESFPRTGTGKIDRPALVRRYRGGL